MKNAHNHHRGVSWLPLDPSVHRAWLSSLITEVEQRREILHPVIARLESYIEGNAEAYVLFNQMFDQGAIRRRGGGGRPGSRLQDHATAYVTKGKLIAKPVPCCASSRFSWPPICWTRRRIKAVPLLPGRGTPIPIPSSRTCRRPSP